MPLSAYTAKIMRRTTSCQVPDCTNVLEKAFYKRYKVCPFHAGEPKVVLNGVPMRFCKGHGRFESLDRFDGERKGCREMLEGVNRRRKRKKQTEDINTSTEEEEDGAGSSTDDEGAVRRNQRRRARREASHSDSDTLRSMSSKESMQTASGPGLSELLLPVAEAQTAGLAALAAPPITTGGPFAALASIQLPSLTVEELLYLHNDPLLPSLSSVPTADLADISMDFPVPPLPHQVLHCRGNVHQHQSYQNQNMLSRSSALAPVSAALPAVPLPMSRTAPLAGPALEMLTQLQPVRHAN